MLRQLVPYEKTTRTINSYCCLTYFFNKIDGNHKDTVWHLSKVLGNVKKNPYIINQNHVFFKKLLWSHFWIDFYKCYTKNIGWELSIFWLVIYIHPYLTCVLTMNLKTTLLASIIRPMYVKIELKHKNQGSGIISTSFVNESISEVIVTFLNVIWFFNIHTINYILNYM